MVAKAKAKGKTASDTLDLKKCHCTLQLSHQCKHTNRSGHTQTHTLTHTLTQRECCGQQPFWPASLAKRKGHLSTETRDNRKRADTHTQSTCKEYAEREKTREKLQVDSVCFVRLYSFSAPQPPCPWGVSSFDTFNGLRLTGGTCGTGRGEAPGTASVATALRPAALQLM